MFYNYIEDLILDTGLTKVEFCKKNNLHVQQIHRLKTHKPTDAMIIRLAKALNIEPSLLNQKVRLFY